MNFQEQRIMDLISGFAVYAVEAIQHTRKGIMTGTTVTVKRASEDNSEVSFFFADRPHYNEEEIAQVIRHHLRMHSGPN